MTLALHSTTRVTLTDDEAIGFEIDEMLALTPYEWDLQGISPEALAAMLRKECTPLNTWAMCPVDGTMFMVSSLDVDDRDTERVWADFYFECTKTPDCDGDVGFIYDVEDVPVGKEFRFYLRGRGYYIVSRLPDGEFDVVYYS